MPSEIREPKKLADWIELDYYKRPRGLKRWRRILVWATFLLCLGGVVAALIAPKGKRLFQAGPLTLAHNMYNDKCSTCHVEAFETAKKFLPWNANIHPIDNKACTKCHHEFRDGRQHSAQVRPEQEPSCASCHQEHRGKMSLTRVADEYCVNCHGDLAAHRKDGDFLLNYSRNIKSFHEGHTLKSSYTDADKDRTRLNFSHHQHLTTESARPDNDGNKLTCANCHQTDDSGRYMKPISFETHCRKCHPLTVQLVGKFEPVPDVKELFEARKKKFNETPALHKELPLVRGELRDRLLFLVQDFAITMKRDPDQNIVEKLLPRQREPALNKIHWNVMREELPKTMQELVDLRKAFQDKQEQPNERLIRGRCELCHQKDKPGMSPEFGPTPVFANTDILPRWMHHARFNHDKHRILQCAVCHEKAEHSKHTTDILMPDLQVCQQCHKPETGVRHDCVECHTYHVRPRQMSLQKGLSIEEALGK